MKCVELITATNSDHFVQYLSPTGPHWGDALDSPWIFRGHASADWKLQARAWRADGSKILAPIRAWLEAEFRSSLQGVDWPSRMDPSAIQSIPAETVTRYQNEQILQIAAEYEAVRQFANLADQLGLQLPGAEEVLSGREYCAQQLRGAVDKRPNPVGVPFCLAQHHGIPTRLLDWTRNPYVAAFFAVEGARDEEDPSGMIAVWALRFDDKMMSNQELAFGRGRFQRVTCPRSAHSFLHAQDGLFVFDRLPWREQRLTGVWPCLEDVVEAGHEDGQPVLLRKIVVARCHAIEVTKRLLQLGVSRARLMPTYDNVTASLISKWRLHGAGLS